MENKKDKWNIEKGSDEHNNEGNKPLPQPKSDTTDTVHIQEIITGQLHKNLVLFAGPREVGKTVTLIRLIHYLNQSRETTIAPNQTFRTDDRYKETINEFLDAVNRPDFNAQRTANVDFLVLDVFKSSDLYCQFLEAPGEAYFDPKDSHSEIFPAYLHSILSDSKLNKVFVFLFEVGMLQKSDPRAYSKRLARLVSMMNRKKDDVIILFNKCDLQRNLYDRNKPNVSGFKTLLYNNNHYNTFFGALSKFGIPVKFVPFSSGDFQKIPSRNIQRWIHSEDFYPQSLWRAIDKCFKGFTF